MAIDNAGDISLLEPDDIASEDTLKLAKEHCDVNENSEHCDAFLSATDTSQDFEAQDHTNANRSPSDTANSSISTQPSPSNLVTNSVTNVLSDPIVTRIPELDNLQIESEQINSTVPPHSVALSSTAFVIHSNESEQVTQTPVSPSSSFVNTIDCIIQNLESTTMAETGIPTAMTTTVTTTTTAQTAITTTCVSESTTRQLTDSVTSLTGPATDYTADNADLNILPTVSMNNNLSSIAEWTTGLDTELANTVIQITDDSYNTLHNDKSFCVTKTVNSGSHTIDDTINFDRCKPLYLDRCSPTQVVASTGGASPEIILNVDGDLALVVEQQPLLDYNHEHLSRLEIGALQTETQLMSGSNSRDPATGVNRPRSMVIKSSCTYNTTNNPTDSQTTDQTPVLNIDLSVVPELTPTTLEEVDASSELIFSNFMTERYRIETANSPVDESGHLPNYCHEFESLPRADVNSLEYTVARNLAQIGDEINLAYGSRLDRMIKLLPIDECPLQMFNNVARVLFTRGPTNWGQVISLFYFGYRLVVQRIHNGIANAFYEVCKCLVSFCRITNIFVWIAQQGGWRILQFLRSRNSNFQTNSVTTNHVSGSNIDGSDSVIDQATNHIVQLTPLILASAVVAVIAVTLIYCVRPR